MINWIMNKLCIRFETEEETRRRIADERKHKPDWE